MRNWTNRYLIAYRIENYLVRQLPQLGERKCWECALAMADAFLAELDKRDNTQGQS